MSAFSVPENRKRPLFATPALSKARFALAPLVCAAVGRNGCGTGSDPSIVPVERVEPDEGIHQRVREPLGCDDELPVLRQHEAFRVEGERRIRRAVRRQQRRDGREGGVAVRELPVGDLESKRVEATLSAATLTKSPQQPPSGTSRRSVVSVAGMPIAAKWLIQA